jgi:hypothetical protein
VFACARLWLGKRNRKSALSWEDEYANNIYGGLVAHNEFGNMNALKLCIPTTLHQAYQNKMFLQRELICFFALMAAAGPKTLLRPVMMAFGNLLVSKLDARGLQMNRDQIADYAQNDTAAMMASPVPWAKNWLAEFRSDPNDNYMVVLFADHCVRLYHACKTGIENTQPK